MTKQSQLFAPTLRENPADAEAISHQLLIRAGYIRQLSAGVYSLLPLGRRALRRLETIIREEMEAAGAQEVLLPALQPAELWRQSGRYNVYGPELIRLTDRNSREFALGPTHEEVITALVDQEISAYRKLPVMLYQIQTKFRDERRPRFGLLRVKEFLMKDAYSFDTSWEGLAVNYDAMYKAYHRIFERCGLRFKAVEADAGAIGGEGGTHEFMAFAESGEDTILACDSCGYGANVEKAEADAPAASAADDQVSTHHMEKFHTPDTRTIQDLHDKLGLRPEQVVKTLIYMADNRPYAVLVRGDHEANETKLKHVLDAEELTLADAEQVRLATNAPVGFAGPVGLNIPIVADYAVAAMGEMIVGANEQDYHIRHVAPGRDVRFTQVADCRNVIHGDACPRCRASLSERRGIEIGHVFKLGTKYSDSMQATYIDEQGEAQPFIMGCYGIGVTRLLAAIVEQRYDENGIIWPAEVAPFQVHVIPVSMQDETQVAVSTEFVQRFRGAGYDVLLDDRDERFGVKLKDADLIGLPIRIVVGKTAGDGIVELKQRDSSDVSKMKLEEAISFVAEKLR
ncbi:prolyl-tRNA synthetase [Paenibacillus phyllosphaerae]|uniref:Proline--tRNA ligase n=1 Tax=Paenibacillus phyllosphaerae TaxID=274593 RepID=A0A7W5B043_9BACL|nr:prolyl-tRNA synthetase [Paenibacillus phyllosphaerae]